MDLRTEIERLYQIAIHGIISVNDIYDIALSDLKIEEVNGIKNNIDRLLDEPNTRNI